MAELATLARPYANAVFRLGKEAAALTQWSEMLGTLAAVTGTEKVRQLIGQPQWTATQKAAALVDLCADALTEQARNLVHVLADHSRLPLLAEIFSQFEALRALEERTLDVQVTTAFELSDSETASLAAALKTKLGVAVELTSSVDSNLIGGAVIRAGDTVIDGSVRGRLGRLQENLQRRA